MTPQQTLNALHHHLNENNIPNTPYTHYTQPHICIHSPHHNKNAYITINQQNQITLTTNNPYKTTLTTQDLNDPNSIPQLTKTIKQWQNPHNNQ